MSDQLSSIDSNNSKAGTFISISSLFIPLSFGLLDNFDKGVIGILVFSVPIILNLIGLFHLIKALFPKKIYHGLNFNEFENLLNKEDSRDLYDFEIGANRDSFKDNDKTLKTQNKDLKCGLVYIYASAIFLTLSILIDFLTDSYHKL